MPPKSPHFGMTRAWRGIRRDGQHNRTFRGRFRPESVQSRRFRRKMPPGQLLDQQPDDSAQSEEEDRRAGESREQLNAALGALSGKDRDAPPALSQIGRVRGGTIRRLRGNLRSRRRPWSARSLRHRILSSRVDRACARTPVDATVLHRPASFERNPQRCEHGCK